MRLSNEQRVCVCIIGRLEATATAACVVPDLGVKEETVVFTPKTGN